MWVDLCVASTLILVLKIQSDVFSYFGWSDWYFVGLIDISLRVWCFGKDNEALRSKVERHRKLIIWDLETWKAKTLSYVLFLRFFLRLRSKESPTSTATSSRRRSGSKFVRGRSARVPGSRSTEESRSAEERPIWRRRKWFVWRRKHGPEAKNQRFQGAEPTTLQSTCWFWSQHQYHPENR